MIVFSLTGIDRVTGETVRFESRYSFIGESVIYFPTPIEEENPTDPADPYDLAITFETFNELYPDGINSFIGTLYAFNDMGELILLEVFSLQENEALTINLMDGEYTQIVRDGENFIQTQGNTDSSETVMTSTDAATFEEASTRLSSIDFSLFNATNLVSLDVNVSFGVIYQVNLDSFDELFNLPLSETMEVTDAYLEITKNYLSVSVYGFDQETGQNFTMYLVLESLNLNVDLLSYLQ
jgi:small nuclear ribonucleoprotein (snRNP)-like protein